MGEDRFVCTTAMEAEDYQFEFEWHVQKAIFQKLISKNGSQNSSTFHTKFCNSSWYIRILTTEKSPDYFGFYLTFAKADTNLIFRYDLIVKNVDKIVKRNAVDYVSLRVGQDWGWKEWAKKDELMLESNWTSDFLTVICKVKIKKENEIVTSEKIYWNAKSDVETITKDLGTLAESGIYSDITLSVGGKKFKAHKNILAVRCEFFATMFGSEFKEASDSEVIIKDIEEEDFECLLNFIYTGKFTYNPSSNISRLLKAADQLALVNFVEYCEKSLEENMTIENCLESYQVADLCSRHNLKGIVLKFIKANIKNVKETEAWKKLKTENMPLICNILESIYEN